MLNHIDDAERCAAMRLVREGRLYDVAHVLDESFPVFPRPPTYPRTETATSAARPLLRRPRPKVREQGLAIARFTGSSIQARLIGVTVAPGAIAFTRMPRPAYSRARVCVRLSIPPLLIE